MWKLNWQSHGTNMRSYEALKVISLHLVYVYGGEFRMTDMIPLHEATMSGSHILK